MQVVPVIDIRNGAVVRARAGRRADYQPIMTPLAATAAPLDVVAGLRRRFDFDALYVADLDAIERRGDNRGAVAEIAAAHPALRLWLDAGAGEAPARDNIEGVIGSESLRDAEAFNARNPDTLLSLDFDAAGFRGPRAVLENAALWPSRVIVMTLARVGVDAGPDFSTVAEIIARAGARRVYAAGGVRGAADLARLRDMGCAGALVASALHDGRLSPADLAPADLAPADLAPVDLARA